jgi:hypothetical protein
MNEKPRMSITMRGNMEDWISSEYIDYILSLDWSLEPEYLLRKVEILAGHRFLDVHS